MGKIGSTAAGTEIPVWREGRAKPRWQGTEGPAWSRQLPASAGGRTAGKPAGRFGRAKSRGA